MRWIRGTASCTDRSMARVSSPKAHLRSRHKSSDRTGRRSTSGARYWLSSSPAGCGRESSGITRSSRNDSGGWRKRVAGWGRGLEGVSTYRASPASSDCEARRDRRGHLGSRKGVPRRHAAHLLPRQEQWSAAHRYGRQDPARVERVIRGHLARSGAAKRHHL
jgi:hypothetical protein